MSKAACREDTFGTSSSSGYSRISISVLDGVGSGRGRVVLHMLAGCFAGVCDGTRSQFVEYIPAFRARLS